MAGPQAGRARLFEVVRRVREANAARLSKCPRRRFSGKSSDDIELKARPDYELAMKMIRKVLAETGITATAGIVTNMYLCKVAMDIVAKHIPADADGVRIPLRDIISLSGEMLE